MSTRIGGFTNILILAFIVLFAVSKQEAHCINDTTQVVSNVDYEIINNNMVITYDLMDTISEHAYFVSIKIKNVKNETITAQTVKGDIYKMVRPGPNKMVIWEISKDYPEFYDSISVSVIASRYLEPPLYNKLIKATIFPGLSTFQETRNKSYLLLGAAGYGSMGLSLYYELKALNNYKLYLKSNNIAERNEYYTIANKKRRLSNYFLYSGIFLWATNYTIVILTHNRDDKKYMGKIKENLSVNFEIRENTYWLFSYTYQF